MKLTFYQGEVPNFGDELNRILWDELIEPGFFDDDEAQLFLGVGSIIWNDFDPDAKKLVVGSGYGGYTDLPDVHDGNWQFCFVRGPRTAAFLGLDKQLAITDSAILTHFVGRPSTDKKFKASFMPHFQSIDRGNWEQACMLAGIHFIDPRDDVKVILDAIEQSELIISEAMHGAILADTLRTPWLAVEPLASLHRHKWYDWSESLEMTLEFRSMPASSLRDFWAKTTGGTGLGKKSQIAERILAFTRNYFIKDAASRLNKLSEETGFLSDEAVFKTKAHQALEALSTIAPVKV
ncbi:MULTISPECIES: polysaccharide pyruvyl transferase family protein [unclassified Endozoicomonas]|uniref:polysaccharide pyruvyl transferase family protein n=1 Tax=unclassified Endozoicomonas TaxID=2644528 RepID=UPI0021481CA2|nr:MULTISPECIES: polysaccharide pyruvyl transferase family protein [unclassified Endozoicomonas]